MATMTEREVVDAALYAIVDAVLYAMRCGCFFPVPEPDRNADTGAWVRWGAMRNLHDKVAALARRPTAPSSS